MTIPPMLHRIFHFVEPLSARMCTFGAVACVAAAVAFPTLFSGFVFDDYVHLLTLEGQGFGASPFDLFRFADGEPDVAAAHPGNSPYPWYTLPSLKIHFFRPLSSALMWLDHALFGRWAVGYHLHSLLWYVLLVWAVALVFRRTLPGPVAGLAVLLYALDDGHIVPMLWWSNRNALVSAAPALLGLAAHLRWREESWRPGLPLSLLGYAVGLLGGETALGIIGYVAAYELIGRARERVTTRLRCLMPAIALAAAYLAAYAYHDFGVWGSGLYHDPIGEWTLFLRDAPGRMLDLAATQFFSLPVELAVLASNLSYLFGAIAAVGLLALAIVLRRLWPNLPPDVRGTVAWLSAGAVFATVPVLATFPSGRLLTLPSIGACAVIAVVIHGGMESARNLPSGLGRLLARTFVALHLLVAPLLWAITGIGVALLMAVSEDAFREMDLGETEAAAPMYITLSAPDPYTGFYPLAMRRALDLPTGAGWQTLSMAPFDHVVTRTAENRFVLAVLDGQMLSTPFERLLRGAQHPFHTGDIIDLGEYRVAVLEMGTWGPRRLEFIFDRPLETADYAFLAWRDGRLRPFSWPPTGKTAVLRARDGFFAWPHFIKRLGLY